MVGWNNFLPGMSDAPSPKRHHGVTAVFCGTIPNQPNLANAMQYMLKLTESENEFDVRTDSEKSPAA